MLFNLISASQKNEQELRREQENDPDRRGNIKVDADIGVPSTRWNYNYLRIRRAMEIKRYAFEMTSQTSDTEAQHLEWLTKQLACERSVTTTELILQMLVWTCISIGRINSIVVMLLS